MNGDKQAQVTIDLHRQVLKLNGMEDQRAYSKLKVMWKTLRHLRMYHFPVVARGYYPKEPHGINTFVYVFPINGWTLER